MPNEERKENLNYPHGITDIIGNKIYLKNKIKNLIIETPLTKENNRLLLAEVQLSLAQARIAELEERIRLANETIRHANIRIDQLKRGAERDNPRDPRGYFRVFGFHSGVFKGLSEDQIQKLVNASYRVMSWVHHPDHGGDQTKMTLLNDARDVLSDPEQRREYLQRQGRFSN